MKTITRLFSVFISAILVFMLPVQILASTFESQSVDIGTIFPKFITGSAEDNKIFNYCKLNNFKNYTKAARFVTNVNGITDNDWKSHSTVSLV